MVTANENVEIKKRAVVDVNVFTEFNYHLSCLVSLSELRARSAVCHRNWICIVMLCVKSQLAGWLFIFTVFHGTSVCRMFTDICHVCTYFSSIIIHRALTGLHVSNKVAGTLNKYIHSSRIESESLRFYWKELICLLRIPVYNFSHCVNRVYLKSSVWLCSCLWIKLDMIWLDRFRVICL